MSSTRPPAAACSSTPPSRACSSTPATSSTARSRARLARFIRIGARSPWRPSIIQTRRISRISRVRGWILARRIPRAHCSNSPPNNPRLTQSLYELILLAKRPCQSASLLNDQPHSRASPLPQLFGGEPGIHEQPLSPARDSGVSGDIDPSKNCVLPAGARRNPWANLLPTEVSIAFPKRRFFMRTLELAGVNVPVIGQGTWRMGEDRSAHRNEVAALRQGIELGMTLIDSAEMYAEGGAEEVVGEAIAGLRDKVFLVSKVYPHNASRKGIPQACERSLRRLNTDYIDLYLLHWRGQYPLEETVEAFERLREDGRIGRWGVSNFDLDDLEELGAPECATNQVLYNLESRGIEFDLLPWSQQRRLPLMAYCPIGQGGHMLVNSTLKQVAARHGVTPAQVALAWILRQDSVIAIPKAVRPEHVTLNAQAAQLKLEAADLEALDQAFRAPQRKQRLAMV